MLTKYKYVQPSALLKYIIYFFIQNVNLIFTIYRNIYDFNEANKKALKLMSA